MRTLPVLPALVALALLIGARETAAGQLVHHVGVADATNWGTTAMPIQVPRHDPAQGTLRSVRVCLRGEGMRRVRVESLDAQPSLVTVSDLSSVLLVQRPSNPSELLGSRRLAFPDLSFALGAQDGVLDFAGSAGADSGALRRGLKPIDYLLTDAADLAYFSGNALATVPFSVRFESHLSGPGNLLVETQALATLSGVVIYTYDDPTPP